MKIKDAHVEFIDQSKSGNRFDFLYLQGGIFHDCMVHDLDQLRWILQEDPETIYSAGWLQ